MLARLKQSLQARQRNRAQSAARKTRQAQHRLVFEPLENRYLLSAEFFVPPDDIPQPQADIADLPVIDDFPLTAEITVQDADRSSQDTAAESSTLGATSTGDEGLQGVAEASRIEAYPGTQLVIVDSSVPDSAALLDQLRQSAVNSADDVRYLMLDSGRDGIEQISEILAQSADVTAVHLFSHGASGFLDIGNNALTTDKLADYRDQLASWGESLTEDADILLYGCNVADGETGIEFVNSLAAYTDADVAASTDTTGSATLGGDWELERTSGAIEATTLRLSDYAYLLENVSATTGSDTLSAAPDSADDNFIFTDVTWGGTDTVEGSTDVDTLDLSGVSTALTITFNPGNSVIVTDGSATITASDIDKVIGGSGADNIVFNDGWGVVTLEDNSFNNSANFDAITNPLSLTTNADATVSLVEGSNAVTLDFGQGDALSALTDISAWQDFLVGDTAVGDAQQGGLTEFTDWGQSLAGFEEFTSDLPAFGLTLEEVLDVSNTVGQLASAVSDYYASVPVTAVPTSQGLIDYLSNTWVPAGTYDGALSTGLNALDAANTGFSALSIGNQFAADGSAEVLFNFDYSAQRTTRFDLDFGAQAQELGIELAANAQVNLTAKLDLVGSFAIGFINSGSQYDPYFFLDVNSFTAAADVNATNLTFGVDVGFLQAQTTTGTLGLDAVLAMDFSAGAGADGLTLTELQNEPLSSLVSVGPSGTPTFAAVLPLDISTAGFDAGSLTALSGATLSLSIADVFSGEAPTVAIDNGDVRNFANLSEDDLLGMLDQLADWLIGVSSDNLLQQQIPFTDGVSLGDALRFGQSFQDNVLAALRDYDGLALADANNSITLNEDFDLNLEVVLDDGAGNLSRELLAVNVAQTFAGGGTTNTGSSDELIAALNAAIDDAISNLAVAGLVAGDVQATLQNNRILFRPTAEGAKKDALETAFVSNVRLPTDRALDFDIAGMDFGGVVAGYETAQEMADLLNTVLGSLTGLPLEADYDAPTGQLSYTIDYAPHLILGDVPVDFSMDLGDFAGIQSNATLGLAADLDMGMTFGVDLSPSAELVVAPPFIPTSVPADGQLSADASFRVNLLQQDASGVYPSLAAFDVVVTADPSNNNVDDLLSDVQAALDGKLVANGLSAGEVYAEYTGERIVLSAKPATVDDANGIPEVRTQRVEVGAASTASGYFYDDPALRELGLLNSPIPFDGVLGADVNLTLAVEGLSLGAGPTTISSINVNLSAAATADNSSVADLVADINAAIAADLNIQAGTNFNASSSPVQAFQIGSNASGETLGNRLGFMAVDGNGITALKIQATGDANDPATKLLGLDPDIDSASRTPAVELFVDNLHLNGEVLLSADDITAEAHFGFMNIAVVDSGGSVSGTAALNLQNSLGDTQFTLQTLFNELALGDIGSLFATTISGEVDIDLAVLPDVGLSDIDLQPGTLSLDLAIDDWLNNPPDLISAQLRDAQNTVDDNASNNILVSMNGLDASVFDNLRNLSLSDVIRGLNQVVDFLRDTQGVGDSDAFVTVLDTQLPLLNASVSDILNSAERFAVVVEELEASPANSLQLLEGVLKEILGLPADSDLVGLALDEVGDTLAVRLDLVFETGLQLSRALDLDLADLVSLAGDVPGLDGIRSLVGVSASGDLSVDMNGRLAISMGLDIGGSSASAEVLGFADGDQASGSGAGLDARLTAGGEVAYARLLNDPVVIQLTVGDAAATSVEVTLDATGVVNSLPANSPAMVSATTTLTELNSGSGVSTVSGNDLRIRLHDGSEVFVDLSAATDIDAVLAAIDTASSDLSANFNDAEQRIEISDASNAAASSNPWVGMGDTLATTAPSAGGESKSGFIVPFVVAEKSALAFTLQAGTRDLPVSVSVDDGSALSRAAWVADVKEQIRLAMVGAGQLGSADAAVVDVTYVAGKLTFAASGTLVGTSLSINMGASPELGFYLQAGNGGIVDVHVDSNSYTGVLDNASGQTISGDVVSLFSVTPAEGLSFTLRVGANTLPVDVTVAAGWDEAAVESAIQTALQAAQQYSDKAHIVAEYDTTSNDLDIVISDQAESGNPVFLRSVNTTDELDFTLRVGTSALPIAVKVLPGWDTAAVNAAVEAALADAGQSAGGIDSSFINGNLGISANQTLTIGQAVLTTLTTDPPTVNAQWLADIEEAVRQAMVDAGELGANDTATVSVSFDGTTLQFSHDDGVTLYQYDADNDGSGDDNGGRLIVDAVNGSQAANDLGLLGDTSANTLLGEALRASALDDELINKLNADLDAALTGAGMSAGVVVASRGADTGNPETFKLVLSGGVVDSAQPGFLQIDSVHTRPQPFLYDTDDNGTATDFSDDTGTQLYFGAGLSGDNLAFTAQLGPFGMWVRDGDASLTGAFTINLLDDNGDGRHYFLQNDDKLGRDDFDWQVNGSATSNLPLYFPTEDQPVADVSVDPNANNMVISISNLADYFDGKATGTTGSVSIETPDLSSFAPPTLIGMLSNPEFLIDGLDALLLSLQDAMDEIMDINLPVIGEQLPNATQMISNFREDILSYLSIKLRQGGLNPVTLVQETLYNVFADEGDGLLGDLTVLGFNDAQQNFAQIESGALADTEGKLLNGAFDARFNLSVDGEIELVTLEASDLEDDTLTGLVNALNVSLNARSLGGKVEAYATADGVGFRALGNNASNTTVRVDTAGAIALNLGGLQFGALGLLQDSDLDTDSIVDINDIFKSGFGTFDEYGQFDLTIGDNYLFGQSLDFDIGIPQLELDLDAGVELELDWGMDFGFGVDQTDGFYFATLSQPNSDSGPVDLGPEMNVTATARLLGVLGFAPGADATGNENDNSAILRGSGELPDSLSQATDFQLQIGSASVPTTISLAAGATPTDIVNTINGAMGASVASLDANVLVLTDPGTATDFGYVQIIDAATAKGQLGFLMVDAQDIPDPSSGDHAGEYSEVVLSASIDLTDPNNDGKLTFSEIVAESTTSDDIMVASFNGSAYLNLGVMVAFDVPGLEDMALLPEISFDLNLDWVDFADFSSVPSNPDAGNESRLGGMLDVSFETIELDLGSFISDFVSPYLGGLGDVLKPLDWLLDKNSGLLYQRLPVISDLAGQTYTFLDLARLFGDLRVIDFLNAVEELYHFIGLVDDAVADAQGNAIKLAFGDLELGDLRSVESTKDLNLGAVRKDAASTLDQQINSPNQGGPAKDFAKNLTKPGKGSFAFPIIQDPSNVFNILLGNAEGIDLVTYDLPPFGLDFDYRQRFPIFPPLFATLRGSMGITIDLGFGYDTTGLIQFSGSNNPTDLINGFFISDVDFSTGEDISELTLSGRISAGASLDAVVASAGVEGGIAANIFFNLNDPNLDGKVRLGEMEANLQLNGYNPIAIFDPSGNINFVLEAYVEVLFGLWEKSLEIANVTLAEFEYSFTRPPLLGAVSDGELLLHVGANAASRYHGDIRDGSESIYAKSENGSVYVWGMGLSESQAQRYDSVDKIVAYGGEGNDRIDLSRVGNVATEIYGGVGNDVLLGGAGVNIIHGGEGNDAISGGNNNDQLFGDEGADTLRGGAGADDLQGGGGNDSLFGEAGQDTLQGGADDDTLDGGANDDTFVMDNAWGADTLVEAQGVAADLLGDVLDFSAVRTDMQIQLGGGNLSSGGNGITASALVNSLSHSGFGIENIKGGRGADLFESYQTDTNTIELNGQGGSDTYIAYASADPSVVMNIALHDVGNLWNLDKAVFYGTDNSDSIVVDQTAVTANASSSFAYGAFGDDSGIETLSVFAKAGDDIIEMHSTPATTAVLINGDEDNDSIVVGSATKGVDDILGSDLSGPIVINGNDGINSLSINDIADDSDNTGSLTEQVLRGLDMGTYLKYTDMNAVSVNLGTGDDEFTISRTIGGTTALSGGDGNDTLNVEAILGLAGVSGDAGVDVINVGIAASQRDIDDVFNAGTYDDPGLIRVRSVAHGLLDGTEISISGVQGIEDINDTFTVSVVDADTFDLQGTRFNVSDEYVESTGNFVDPGADTSLQRITEIESTLTVSGGADADDIVNINDSAATEDVTTLLTATTVTASDMPGQVDYDNSVEILNLQTGFGNDSLNAVSSTAGVHAILWGNSGNDVFTISSEVATLDGSLDDLQGEITVRAGDGLNGLYISDRADADADTNGLITANRITGLAPAAINYFTSGSFVSGVRIWAGAGDDVIAIQSSLADNVTSLWANGGNDRITLNDMSAGADGLVAVFGQAGRDVLDASAWNTDTLLFGDDGDWDYATDSAPPENLRDFFTTNPEQGDSDVLRGGSANDALIGGAGGDTLFGNDGNDLLSGDGGTITFQDGVRYKFQTSSHFIGGDDWLDGGTGNDVMLGGFGHDTFVGNLGDDVMVGEYSRFTVSDGKSDFVVRLGQGGQDLIATTLFNLYDQPVAEVLLPTAPAAADAGGFVSETHLAALGTVSLSPMQKAPSSHEHEIPVVVEPPPPPPPEPPAETPPEPPAVEEPVVAVAPPSPPPVVEPPRVEAPPVEQPKQEQEVECVTVGGELLDMGDLWTQFRTAESFKEIIKTIDDMIEVATGKEKHAPVQTECAPAGADSIDPQSSLDSEESSLLAGVVGMTGWQVMCRHRDSAAATAVNRDEILALQHSAREKRIRLWQDGGFRPAKQRAQR